MDSWLKRHPALDLFAAAGFDLTPIARAVDFTEYRPFDAVDVALIESFLSDLSGFLGRWPVVRSLQADFAEDEDVILFSIIEAMPLIVLDAASKVSARDLPEPVLRTLIAGTAENPDGAPAIARALLGHGVSLEAVAQIFHRAHSRVLDWRLYFVAQRLLGERDLRLADLAEAVAEDEPLVFASPAHVVRTVTSAVRGGTLMVERAGRMPQGTARGAWAGSRPLKELIEKARERVLAQRAFVGSDHPAEISTRLWRCRK